MASIAWTGTAVMVKKGGPVTTATFTGDGSNTWVKGQILKLNAGAITLTPVATSNGGIDTDGTGSSGMRLFIALSDVTVATSAYVPVQEILRDTVFEAKLAASSTGSTVPVTTLVNGAGLAGYQVSGRWAIDVDNTTKPVFKVIDTSDNYNPHDPASAAAYGKVYVKVLEAILQG